MDRLQPFNPDENLIALAAAGNLELFALRCAAPDEDRVVPAFIEQCPQTVDRRAVADVDTHIDDVADFFVEDLGGEAKGRDVDAHQPAGLGRLLENRHLIPERHQVVGHG